MKKTKFFLVIFLFVCSCAELTKDKNVEIVKNTSIDLGLGLYYSTKIVDLVNEIAGINGTTKWKSFKPADFEQNPNVICVQVDIVRNEEKNNKIIMQFLLNTSTNFVKQGYFEVDGEGKSQIDFYYVLMSIGIDNLK